MDDIGELSENISNASSPISFTVESKSGSHSLNIQIVKVISRIDMFDLVHNCNTNKDMKLLRIKDTVMSNFIGDAFIIKISVRNSDDITGVLYNIKQNVFGLIQNIAVPQDHLRLEIRHPETEDVGFHDSANTYIKKWTIVGDAVDPEASMGILEDLKRKLSSFSMKPISSPVKHTLLPSEFLESRYYTTFYSQNTPLSYFPKTALTRFKNMCETSDTISLELRKLCMLIDELDRRHTGRFGILTQEKNNVEENSKAESEIERQCKLEFIERHSDLFQPVDTKNDSEINQKFHASLSSLATELKIRETQLQMLILLELFASRIKVSEEEFFIKNDKIQEEKLKKMQLQTKQLLVRQKKKKKIVPTFLGMGVTLNLASGIDLNTDEDIFIYTTLNSLIDRMGIWDTLSERKGSEDSSYEFLAYVLVPYYNKRIPVTIKYIIDKIKGLNLKFDRKSSSGSASRTTSRRGSNSGSAGGSAGNSTNGSSRSSPRKDVPAQKNNDQVLLAAPKISEQNLNNRKQRKTLLKDRRPLLTSSRTLTGILGNDLLPAFSIKRSKSSVMSSSKSLEKRQVDVSKSFSESNESRNSLSRMNSSSEMQLTQSQPQASSNFIFGNSKKVRVSSGPSNSFKDETLQVAATPIKKKPNKITNVLSGSNKGNTNSTAQVQATPSTDRHIIIQTPEMAPPSKKKLTIYEKFLETADINSNLNKNNTNSLVASSPGLPSSILDLSPSSSIVAESPANAFIKRKRPGEPVSAQDSPFFGSNFQGSPINNNKRVDTDDDEDSDYERLLARISPPKKKTVFARASKAKHH